MNRVLSRLGLTAVSLVAGSALYAQSSTTGAVAGVVTDANGAPLAGASVTMTSAQVTRTATTGADGSFRLSLLNPGTWSVRVSKDGFQAFSSTVLVSTNDVKGVNVKLPSTASATVDVVGVQSQVDVTSTTQGLQMTMEQMAAVPKGRDMSSMAFFAPGVTDSGGMSGSSPSISGASAAENTYVLDGLNTTDMRKGYQGASLVTDFIDQVEVQTGGFRPEFSALGGVFNAVTKSGSNDFKGSAWLTWDAVGIHAAAKKNAYAIEAAPDTRYDIGAEVGGAIIKDKLFYFVGVDSNIDKSTTQLPNNDPGLVSDQSKDTTIQSVAKINWFLTQDMQVTFFANYNHDKFEQGNAYPTYGTGQLGFSQLGTVSNYNLSYDWNISPNLLLSAKIGFTDNKTTQSPTDLANQAVSDQYYYIGGPGSTGPNAGIPYTYRTGGTGLYQPLYEGKTTQAKLDLSWFVGSHNLKFGFSDLESKYTLEQAQGGPANPITASTAADAGVLYPVTYTVDSSGRLNTYEEHTNATVKTTYQGLYAQDTWEMFSGFRLMYGARYEEQQLKDSSGNTFLKFSGSDYIQPRIGFTWDLNNDGKTKIAGSYATYFEDIPQQVSIRVFANEVYLRHRYSKASDIGGANTSWAYNNGSPTISNYSGYSLTIDYATPFSYDPIANGTKLPQRQEYTLGMDHTLDSGWTLGVHGKYRKLKNIIEDSVLTGKFGTYYDSGLAYAYSGATPIAWAGQAILWNPGPGSVSWTARTSPYSLNSGQVINVPASGNYYDHKAGNEYDSVDFTASKKTDRDFVNFSYTWSRLQGNYEGLVSSSNGQPDSNITASFDYYPYVGFGLLPLDRTNVAKLQWSHRFTVADNDLNVGWTWTYQSGNPLSLFDDGSFSNGNPEGWDTNHVVTNNPADPGHPYILNQNGSYGTFYDIGGYGNAVPANGQLGQFGRTPATNLVSFHADYTVKAGQKLRVIPSVDVFNFFNARTANTVGDLATTQSGSPAPSYGQELGWLEGRNFRFGVKVQF